MTPITALTVTTSAPSTAGRCSPGEIDTSVEGLRRLLHARPSAAVSLDFFDTVVWRAVPKPTDVFWLVGHRLADQGLLSPGVSPRTFLRLRILAEQFVRNQSVLQRDSAEVSLEDIYRPGCWRRLTALGPGELAEQELAVETRITTPDPCLRELFRDLRRREPDRTVFLVSDTWLDATGIRRLLGHAGLDFLLDVPIFTSSEHGVGKAAGLLALALGKLQLEPSNCIHVGDSLIADVKPAAALGITTVHVPQAGAVAAHALPAEGWTGHSFESSELLDPATGDSCLTALRGRMARRRPLAVPLADSVLWDVGATTLGPVFAGFTEWVHERASMLGIDTALCLMREGRFLAGLLDGVPAPARRCAAVPFWASRAACIRSTFFTANRDELARVLWRADTPTPQEILTVLSIRPEEVPGCVDVMNALSGDHRPDDVANAFLDFLGARHDVRDLVVQRSAVRRKSYLRYLQGAIVGDSRRVALVDLGFGGTIQDALREMVAAEGLDLEFHGLYLFTNQQALVRQLRGNLVEGFLADAGTPRTELAVLERSPQVLEVLTTSSEGSLLEIDEEGHPVLAPRPPNAAQDQSRDVLQEGVRAFQRAWSDFSEEHTLGAHRRLSTQPKVLHRLLSTFMARPGRTVAEALSSWTYEENCESGIQTALVPSALARAAAYVAPEHLVSAKPEHLHWVGAAATFGNLEREVAWLQQGDAPLGTFLTSDAHGQLLFTVVGRGGARTVETCPLRGSNSGTGVVAWHGTAHVDHLSLHTSGPAAVVRLDRVRVEREDGTIDSFDWGGDPRLTPPGVRLTADMPVADGMAVLSENRGLTIALTVERATRVTSIEVLYRALAA